MTGTVPTPRVNFPSWARFALGAVIFLVQYLITGSFIHIGDEERGVISGLVVLFATSGVVPPTPGLIKISPGLNFVLMAVVILATYFANTLLDLEPLVRGLILGAVAFAASIGVTPPQARTG